MTLRDFPLELTASFSRFAGSASGGPPSLVVTVTGQVSSPLSSAPRVSMLTDRVLAGHARSQSNSFSR
jgi:hypothetical protein